MTERELHTHLPEIINTMNDGLFCTRTDGTIMLVNDALTRITGFSREELMDRTCAVLGCDACDRSRAEGETHHCRLFLRRVENRKNCHIRCKDGTLRHVLKNASLLRAPGGEIIGAVETVTDITELDVKERRIRELSLTLDEDTDFHGMVGRSTAMRAVYNLLEKAARTEAPVLILGESGTGKELAARAIHALGPRRDLPYVQVNCAALNESLLESELFGHAKGAFTGAIRHRLGRFEEAGAGDLFLDEIGDVPVSVQVKLLRVLETRRFERVGDSRPLPLEARLITATHQDLPSLVAAGRFREDFYYRVNVLPIRLPALRERPEDIPLLAGRFVESLRRRTGKDVPGLSPEAMALLTAHAWPGNARELRSALEYAFMVLDHGPVRPEHLPPPLSGRAGACPEPDPAEGQLFGGGGAAASTPAFGPSPASGGSAFPLGGAGADPSVLPADPAEAREKRELLAALAQAGGNQTRAAALLGVSRLTVANRMRKHGVRRVVAG
jgi:PAS domain S-box-containing protein